MKRALQNPSAMRLGVALLVWAAPLAARAQSATTPMAVPALQEQTHRLFRLPLANIAPKFLIDKLNHVYYYRTRPVVFGSRAAAFNANASPASEAGFVPSPLRIDGVSFIVTNDRDNSLLVSATPDGYNMLKEIVVRLDVPVTAPVLPGKHGGAAGAHLPRTAR